MSCPNRPPCPEGTSTWHCAKRAEIELAMFHGTLDRDHGEGLLRAYHLLVRPMSATEMYQRDARRREKGLLF